MSNNIRYGVDVSEHNGPLNHAQMRNAGVTFAMVRAGWGKGHEDSQFKRNIEGFLSAGIDVGAYWFIYSLNQAEAVREAEEFDKILSPYKGRISFPVAADFEYDSERWMRNNGVTPEKHLNTSIVKAFCDRLKELGWYVVNYSNLDFINNHFNYSELDGFDLWCAQWGVSSCDKTCGMWQYSSDAEIPGSSKRTDANYAYKDYPTIIKNNNLNGYNSSPANPDGSVLTLVEKVMQGEFGSGNTRVEKLGVRYDEVQNLINHIATADCDTLAHEVISGMYGSGSTRETVLGTRYNEIQNAVNSLLQPPKKSVDEIAHEVIRGLWGSGKERTNRLNNAGYDSNAVQKRVNELM